MVAPQTRPGADPAPPSRAGRNLPLAIATGVGMGGAAVASLVVVKEAFVVLALVAVLASVWELADALSARRHLVPRVPLLAGTAVTLPVAYLAGLEALLASVALTAAAVVLWRLLAPAREHGGDPTLALRDVTSGVLAVLWLPLLAGFAMLMLREEDGAGRIFLFVLLAVASDTGGYAAGVLFGRHPMAPTISPKKSWEGLAGSGVLGLVAGVAGVVLVLGGSWWAGALVGLAAVTTATLGDLAESVLKRDLGIKDMGSLIPGHGGVMDRLDSLLLSAPVLWLLLGALVPPPA
ncbi:MAG: Phosphatidate cytidylyltransferase [uncultured Quadrisphaera sp.]|uniref:Phosphatidate cytidylyltransferase n=1 Tax=uncultured Quadrisphaera sp. TaxID=904978 RepID=A0A6J4P2Q8_9ACTN|nr:MAG: Phosphatidate cytidylyltransferase [uncultured Quadrisphaera sp.]